MSGLCVHYSVLKLFDKMFGKISAQPHTLFYYAYSLCSKETIGITIVRLWDYSALFLLVFVFLAKSMWGLPKSSNFRKKIWKI